MSIKDILQVYVKTSSDLLNRCGERFGNRTPLHRTSRSPELAIPSATFFLPEDSQVHLSPRQLAETLRVVQSHVHGQRRDYLKIYNELCSQLLSVQAFGGIPDGQHESQVAKVIDAQWSRTMQTMRETVLSHVGASSSSNHQMGCDSGVFRQGTLHILEAAYSKKTTISNAETHAIAQLASITPQQVRTWFQNKRNRQRKAHRVAVEKGIDGPEDVDYAAPSQRRISALPRRAAGGRVASDRSDSTASDVRPRITSDSSVPSGTTRRIKALPRRAGLDGEKTTVGAPMVRTPSSGSEASSLDSINPSGGFTSLLNNPHSGPPIITLQHDQQYNTYLGLPYATAGFAAQDLSLATTFPQQPILPSSTGLTTSPLDLIPSATAFDPLGFATAQPLPSGMIDFENYNLPEWNSEEFEALLNDAIYGSHIQASPTFSDGMGIIDYSGNAGVGKQDGHGVDLGMAGGAGGSAEIAAQINAIFNDSAAPIPAGALPFEHEIDLPYPLGSDGIARFPLSSSIPALTEATPHANTTQIPAAQPAVPAWQGIKLEDIDIEEIIARDYGTSSPLSAALPSGASSVEETPSPVMLPNGQLASDLTTTNLAQLALPPLNSTYAPAPGAGYGGINQPGMAEREVSPSRMPSYGSLASGNSSDGTSIRIITPPSTEHGYITEATSAGAQYFPEPSTYPDAINSNHHPSFPTETAQALYPNISLYPASASDTTAYSKYPAAIHPAPTDLNLDLDSALVPPMSTQGWTVGALPFDDLDMDRDFVAMFADFRP